MKNKDYNFAELAGKYYAREMEFEKEKNKLLEIIKVLLLENNGSIPKNHFNLVFRCPICKHKWDKGGIYKFESPFRVYESHYVRNGVCNNCYDKFSKMDTEEMINLFQM